MAEKVGEDKVKQPKANQQWTINAIFVVFVHVVALQALVWGMPSRMSWILFGIFMLGITMGYHRLWSHRSYQARLPLRILLAICGTLGFQGSIKWWCERHRLHHRFTDTKDDPYNAKEGFWYSHIGWIFQKPYYPKLPLIDVGDLLADPVVRFQHRYFVPLALGLGFGVPLAWGWYWGDVWGSLLYAGFVSKIIVWHATFCINSLAHWLGEQDYSIELTARGNLLLAVITHGEGHHNFHHQFPSDYRNGVRWYHYDPTKWCIAMAKIIGLAHGLRITPEQDIKRSMIATAEDKIAQMKTELGDTKQDDLPQWSMADLRRELGYGRHLIFLDSKVYDVTEYRLQHPGGERLLKAWLGRDASEPFHGGLNNHTQAARLKAETLCVARLNPIKNPY